LEISINGGIKSLAETQEHLKHIDGVMIGREIYQNPYLLTQADSLIWNEDVMPLTRTEIVEAMAVYIDRYVAEGGKPWHVLRHMLGLCNGLAGAKQFRRYLSENANQPGANSSVLFEAFAKVGV
jgi:tRNA-dihydrouridine synthase A